MSLVTLISDENDGTTHYFANFLKQSGSRVRHYYWGMLGALPAKFICELVDGFTLTGGLFVREPAQFDLFDCALRDAIFACAPSTVSIISPSRTTSNWSKLLHEQALRAHEGSELNNVRILESLVAKRNARSSLPNVRYVRKNISSVPGLTKRVLNVADMSQTEVDSCATVPSLVQPELVGTEYRVHVVDDIALPFKLLREPGVTAVDSPIPCPCEVAELPTSILEHCIRLTSREGLRFSGIDLIECADENYWLLEVNPMPGYHAYESRLIDSSTPVSDTLRHALLSSHEGAP